MAAISPPVPSQQMLTKQLSRRRLADQVGRLLLIIVLIVTVAAYVIVPFQAVSWLQVPFIGAMLNQPNAVNDGVGPTFEAWPGLDAGLALGDVITAIDGQAVSTSAQIQAVLREHQVGDTVTLSVTKVDGSQVELPIELISLSFGSIAVLFLVPYAVGLIYLATGLWVYRNRRDRVLGRGFLLFCAALALAFGTTFDLWTTHLLSRVWTAAVPLAAGAMFTVALIFPDELSPVLRRPLLRWIGLVPAIAMVIWGQITFSSLEARLMARSFTYYFAALAAASFLITLGARAVLSPSPAVREQSRVVVLGSILAFAPFIVWAIDSEAISVIIVLLVFALFPLVIAYSILQYSVLDTGRGMSWVTTHAVMGSIIVVGFGLIVAGIASLTTTALGDVAVQPGLVALFGFLLVLGFQPLRDRLQMLVDSLFFRSRVEYQERLTAFRHELTLAGGLSEIVRLLKQQLRETVMPTHAYVFLRDHRTGEFVAAGEGARPDTDIRFEPQSGLVHALSTTRDALFLEPNRPLPPEMVEEYSRLAVLRTPIMTPLQGQNRLAGWVAIGPKRSGDSYDIEDLRFIQALSEQASLAVERAQVIGDLERRLRELDVLRQVSQAVNFTTDPDVLLELIYTQTSKLIDTTNFYIITHHPETQTLSYAFYLENDERFEEREGIHWPDHVGLAAEVVATGRPVRTDDYLSTARRLSREPGESRSLAWMGVPLNAGERTLGTMVVASHSQPVVFTEDQLKIFWAIADQAATALDKARLFTETETRARQLATLNEISKEMSSLLDLETLLGRILGSAVELLEAEAGSLFLIDDTTDELVFRVVVGGAQNLVGTRLPPGVGIAGQAAEQSEPVLVNNVRQDHRWYSDVDAETEFQTQALLAVPLTIHEEVIGVVEVINKSDGSVFEDDDISLLTTFASQAAVAIENARLYQATDAELSARVDELQNLQRIDRELNRTLRLERVVQIALDWAMRTTGAGAGAVVMMDNEGRALELLAASGYEEEFLRRFDVGPVPVEMGIVGRVLATGKPEFVRNVIGDPDFVTGTRFQTVAEMVVPLLRANQPVGALVLETHIEDLLDDDDFEFIQRLVEHAAVAIENSRLLQEVEEANRSKTEFVSFVAHELKNPMTSIRGYTDLLRSGQVGDISDMQGQFLGTIRSNVDRMSRLVSDLADVARIEAGQLRLERGAVDVHDVVDETLRGLQGQIEEKNQELVVNISDDLPPIMADHTRMVQIMTNLVSNAHKYTPDGGTIWVGAEPTIFDNPETGTTDRAVHHWVRDTGIGMSAEEMELLFTKFYRTQRGKDMAQGTGLGLNITKNLVERHGGMIWVDSDVGQGTTFHLNIPIAAQSAGEAHQAAD